MTAMEPSRDQRTAFSTMRDFARRWRWPVMLSPLLVIACFGTFIVRARMTLGVWPSYDHPDPKALGFGIHHFVTMLGFALLSPIAFISVLWTSFASDWRRLTSLAWATAALLMVVAVVLFLWVDPGGFVTWFID